MSSECCRNAKGEWLKNDATLSVNIPKLNVQEAFSSECLNTGVMAAISKCRDEKTGDATVENVKDGCHLQL